MSRLIASGTVAVHGGTVEPPPPSCVRRSHPAVDVVLNRIAPLPEWITVSAAGDASLGVSLSAVNTQVDSETWGITSVSVIDGGSGNKDGASIGVSFTGRVAEIEAADLVISTDRSQPSFQTSIESDEGANASLALSFSPVGKYWELSGVTVSAAGSGYRIGDKVKATANQGTYDAYGNSVGVVYGMEVSKTGEGGGVSGVSFRNFSNGYYSSTGKIESVDVYDKGECYGTTTIKRLDVLCGGSFISSNACKYSSDFVCASCPEEFAKYDMQAGMRSRIRAEFQAGVNQHSLSVWSYSGLSVESPVQIISATAEAIDGSGDPIPCHSLEFKASGMSGECGQNGTIAVVASECGDSDVACDMPDQIAAHFSIPAYSFKAMQMSPLNGCYTEQHGSTPAFSGTIILDRTPQDSCSTFYEGYGEGGIFDGIFGSFFVNIRPIDNVVTVTISPPDAPPEWYPNQPERRTATAEVDGIADGGVSSISVTDGGAGYEYGILVRVAPTVTLTADNSNGGSGASLSATLEQIGSGDDAVWGIKTISILDGGSGYPASGAILVEVAEGEYTVTSAELTYFANEEGEITGVSKSEVQARRKPGVTVAGTNGAGASLTANVVKWSPPYSPSQAGWTVESVTVVSGGSGYVDGEPVVFTLSDPGVTVVGGCLPVGYIETVQEKPIVSGFSWLVDGSEFSGIPAVTGTGAAFDPLAIALAPKEPATPYELFGSNRSSCASGRPRWGIAGVVDDSVNAAIVSGGSGYQVGNILKLAFSGSGNPEYPETYSEQAWVNLPHLYVSSVNQYGAITGLKIASPGRVARNTGVIRRVDTDQGDCYQLPTYIPATKCPTGLFYTVDQTVPVGEYYAIEETGQTHVSDPTVTITSVIGSGAEADATISNGAVASIQVTNPGSGYSPQRKVWMLDVSRALLAPSILFGPYLCDGGRPLGRVPPPGACGTSMGSTVTAGCPSELLGKTYDYGFVRNLTTDVLTSGPGVSYEEPTSDFCDYWRQVYGLPPVLRWFLTGATVTISAV